MKRGKLTRNQRRGLLALLGLHLTAIAGVTSVATGMAVESNAVFWTGMVITGGTVAIMITWAGLYAILTRKSRREESNARNAKAECSGAGTGRGSAEGAT